MASLGLALSPFIVAVLLTPIVPALGSPLWRALVGAILYIALASMVPTTAYAVAVSHGTDGRLRDAPDDVLHRHGEGEIAGSDAKVLRDRRQEQPEALSHPHAEGHHQSRPDQNGHRLAR